MPSEAERDDSGLFHGIDQIHSENVCKLHMAHSRSETRVFTKSGVLLVAQDTENEDKLTYLKALNSY